MPSLSLQPLFLKPHPGSTPGGIDAIQVTLACLVASELKLTFVLSGDISKLRIPAPTAATRADGLWQHTCCEAFIRGEGSPAYVEFNFSPSGQWQAYGFTDYRLGGLLEPATDPQIECSVEPGRLTLTATLQSADLPAGNTLHIGLAAVLESVGGDMAYWALQHAIGKPDFHHPDTFALDIKLK
jgi:hypothetical protein